MAKKTKPVPYEKIWWLLPRDLICWASVMVGTRNGHYEIWASFEDRYDLQYSWAPRMRIHGLGDVVAVLEVNKISETDLLSWWRTWVETAKCEWNEVEARQRLHHLLLLEPKVEQMRLQLKELGQALGRAAPLWLQLANDTHGCKHCREVDANMGNSSTVDDILHTDIEQARARLRYLESLLQS